MGDLDLRLNLGPQLDLLSGDLDRSELDATGEDRADQVAEVLEVLVGSGEIQPVGDALHPVRRKQALELASDVVVHVFAGLALVGHKLAFLEGCAVLRA